MARLPACTPRWSVRPLFWWQRFRYGSVLEPIQLWARSPRVLRSFLRLFGALRRKGSPLTPQLRSLVAVRVSQVVGCDFCIDMNGSFMLASGAPEEKLLRVGNWRAEMQLYAETERVALEYAEAVTSTPPAVTDDLFRRLRASFSEEAVVELTALAAFQNMSARFNTALDAQVHGFCRIPQSVLRSHDR
jgi:uncharacterized peroxidase-related enzyme